MIESLVDAVGDGPVIEQRGVNLAYSRNDVVRTAHVEQGVLLSGEGRFGQVLRRGRGTDRDADLRSVAKPLESRADRPLEAGGQRRLADQLAYMGAGAAEQLDIVHVQAVQHAVDGLAQPVLVEKFGKCVRCRGEAAGNPYTQLVQVGDHFSQRRVFPADALQIILADGRKADDVFAQAILPLAPKHDSVVWQSARYFSCPTAPASPPRRWATASLPSSTESPSCRLRSRSSTASKRRSRWRGESTGKPNAPAAGRSSSPVSCITPTARHCCAPGA